MIEKMIMAARITNLRCLIKLTLFFLLAFNGTYSLAADEPTLDYSVAGKIINIAGTVEVLIAGQSNWEQARNEQLLFPGDSIRTGTDGKASLIMSDETMIQLNRNTHFQLKQVERNAGWFGSDGLVSGVKSAAGSLYEIFSGKVWARNKNRKVSARFETPTVTAGIRGTELTIEVSDNSVRTDVIEGRVEHSNDYGRVVAEAGEYVITRPGEAPVKQILLQPEEAVQWTLLIPAIFNETAADTDAIDRGAQNLINNAIAEARYSEAAELIKQQRNINDSSQLQVLEAVVDIYQGSPVQAKQKLLSIQRTGYGNGSLSRALAMAALLTNDNELAFSAAKQAMQIEPDVAASTLVMAYIHQSRYEIEVAQALLAQLLEKDSNNVQALYMLAQLQFASGYNEQAWSTMQRAQALDPENAYVNNLAGFILLAQREHEQSYKSFKKALESDTGMAESHMGLGLLAMRHGRINTALEEITTAIALEPQRAIFLSYWGKMLYQIKRFDKALDMFNHAEKLDTNDPTPSFYKSIVLRDLNRPGEAIEAMNTAVAKNDNQGVNRSRFLLDEDLATRNVDLSILYESLGLSRWAESKAVSAIKSDYTNYSAHLFLAGALGEQEDRSYGYGSEALLARLMQPANVNTFNTFNNYTTMFEQPEIGGQITVGGGTDETAIGEAIVYGAAPDSNFAWNVGVFGDTTDGWRETNFEDKAAAAFIGKWQPDEKHGLFASALYSEIRQGDKQYPRYEYDDLPYPEDRLNLELWSAELGYHYNASPGNDFLAYVAWQENKGDSFSTTNSLLVDAPGLYLDAKQTSDFERPYTQLQLQYMKKHGSHQIIAGMVGFSGNTTLHGSEEDYVVIRDTVPATITPLSELDPRFLPTLLDNKVDISFVSVYTQDNWNINRDWQLEAALYFDRMEDANVVTDDSWTIEKVNPRLGVIWSPNTRHTLRLAAFRYMLPFVSSRTDPTEIAGIPIFRNTVEGSQTEEVNFVWEYERSYGLYTFNLYTLDKSSQIDSSDNRLDGNTTGGKVGLDMLITDSIGLSTSYRYEDVEDELQPDVDREDHLASLGLKYLSPGGFSAGITQTYRATNLDNRSADKDNEDISLTDVEFGYEFADKAGRVDLLVRNVFDEQFNWVVDSYTLVGRNPAREVLLRATVNF